MEGERDYLEKRPPFTWLAVRDYFETFRTNRDLIGLLHPDEVESLTAAMHVSGAYNRTLTPFGFQTERRTFWEAPALYTKMSPFWFVDKIKAPILLVHGEADDNNGTFPIQSERFYAALRGNGGTVRLVMLPAEAHGYRGKETMEHVVYEELAWFDKYLK